MHLHSVAAAVDSRLLCARQTPLGACCELLLLLRAVAERVRRTALHLASMEGLNERGQLVVQLGALLHDISDHKYGGSNEQAQAAIRVSTSRGQ
jgi:hypothetical protein